MQDLGAEMEYINCGSGGCLGSAAEWVEWGRNIIIVTLCPSVFNDLKL